MENTIQQEAPKKSKKLLLIIGPVIAVAAFFVIKKVSYSFSHEQTDNAQIESNISPVSSRIQGFVTEILVTENQPVRKGDTLVRIDARDLQLKVLQAEINLQNAEANLEVIRSNSATASANNNVGAAFVEAGKANIDAARIRLWKAEQDFKRYENMYKLKSATQQQYEVAKTEKESAEKQVDVLVKTLNATTSQRYAYNSQFAGSEKQIRLSKLTIEQRMAELEVAQLNLSFAAIIAPFDGIVAKKTVQLGQLVNAGQTLMSVVDESQLWITANFKETQIEEIKVGQEVSINSDAYGSVDFVGVVKSIAPASGSRFALLPTDNSSGNFVKVVQRIPVRIVLKEENKEHPLKSGMNVEVAVNIK